MDKSLGFHFDSSYLSLPHDFYTVINPQPVMQPEVVIINHALAKELNLNLSHIDEATSASIFSGQIILQGSTPMSQAYAGHQFGHFTMLGDGRAHLLGEHLTSAGIRVDVQLKGSGRTPYSRRGDGRATLGPMLREYIMSEAMHHLGIATTRSLAVVRTGDVVRRETVLQGAILTRIASSHIRVGTFEYAATLQNTEYLKQLLDCTINRHYPELNDSDNPALALLNAVMEKQTDLIAHWMRVGFIHGVMNTDNMTLSGETIDYGPCAFMDAYDPKTVFSSIDTHGRYAYANQPKIAQWNLARLAEALLPLIDTNSNTAVSLAEEVLNQFPARYHRKWVSMKRAKLGLMNEEKGDEQLVNDLLDWMTANHADYTNTFLALTFGDTDHLQRDKYANSSFQDWLSRWHHRRQSSEGILSESKNLMKKTNPAVIPRNHQVERALEAALKGDLSVFEKLLEVLQRSYDNRADLRSYQHPPTPSERVYQTFCGT